MTGPEVFPPARLAAFDCHVRVAESNQLSLAVGSCQHSKLLLFPRRSLWLVVAGKSFTTFFNHARLVLRRPLAVTAYLIGAGPFLRRMAEAFSDFVILAATAAGRQTG